MRLFFKEPGKIDQQERFKRLYANMKNHESSEHAELKELQDGAIIGDGRSDVTLETKSYTLKHNNQSFVLLDVPGIDGDEKKVRQQISNATKKAHAIFYVTKTPAPPQKGEQGKEGTIEKIQKQLDSQTEVYTLFNKPINSPRALKDGLIDENEKKSLRDLNKKMKAILGKHYEGYKAVSAQAAFYGLSSALLPETDFYKNKQKFLAIFKVEELLLKSHFKQLGGFIAGELLENSRKKIIESNCNKALKVIEKLQKAIVTTIDRQIDPTIKELKNRQKETYSNLDRSRDKFVSNLNNSVSKEIERFKSDLREEMYAHIDRDIEDDECKEIFENEREQRTEKLRENIRRCFNKCKE
nr:GTPase [Helicobacter pylori]